MTILADQKSQLAKLMATENLTVQHAKLSTARFDPKNRILYLPIWKDMVGHTYDHLAGHEVGHALHTPADGWHDAVVDKSKGQNYKSFLNVIEDARIEKKVIRRYPGLRSSFRKSFADMMAKDFFGIQHRSIDTLPFIDRLNLRTKSQYSLEIYFNDVEQQFLDEVEKLETWEQVVDLTNRIYDYSKNEQFENDYSKDFDGFGFGDDDTFGDYEYDDVEEETDTLDKSSKKSQEVKSNEDEDGDQDSDDESDGENPGRSKKGQSGNDGEEVDEGESTNINRHKDSNPSDGDTEEPRCLTDENFREMEASLLDPSSKPYVYISLPTPDLKKIVTPASRVHEQLSEYYSMRIENGYLSTTEVNELVRNFRNKNERYVSLLAKEFEMRKAAKAYSKAKQSDTGDIDINKLASYRFDDNIFRKLMIVPKGKSHGLMLLLDFSGSMNDNMAGSIEQILVLAMFCRKVNIPFSVYSFSNSDDATILDSYGDSLIIQQSFFSKKQNELDFSRVKLREYLNSKMSNAEFSKCLRNMVLLRESFTYSNFRRCRPVSESLSATPMNEAIVAIQPLMNEFKKKNNLDLTSLVIVHDGDADENNYVCNYADQHEKKFLNYYGNNIVLQDKKYKFEAVIETVDMTTKTILEWFAKTTNSKIFGFFILPPSRNSAASLSHKYYDEDGKTPYQAEGRHGAIQKSKELVKKLKSQKLLISKNPGYNSFFFIPGGYDLMTGDDEFEYDGKLTSKALTNAFMKFTKTKQLNRVLVNRFIEGIAT